MSSLYTKVFHSYFSLYLLHYNTTGVFQFTGLEYVACPFIVNLYVTCVHGGYVGFLSHLVRLERLFGQEGAYVYVALLLATYLYTGEIHTEGAPGPATPALSSANSLATTGWILFKFGIGTQ